jgi:ABC-type dipeptide/oligopeptide/nickel transport system permease subunit
MAGMAVGRRRDESYRTRPRDYWSAAFSRLVHTRSGVAGLVIVGALVLVGILGPFVAPWDYRVQDLKTVIDHGGPVPPLWPGHLFGTDVLGRDMFSRTIDGAQVSMTVAIIAQLVVLLIGVPVGAIAGWRGGRTETLLMRITDVMYAFPDLLFVIFVVSALVDTDVFHWLNGLFVVFLAIGLSAWVTMARLVRAQVISLKHRDFVEAATAIGVPGWRIVLRHILPNSIGPVVVAVSLGLPTAIILESTLSFLGLGVQGPRASWGSLIAYGLTRMDLWPWLVVPPMVALAISLVGFTLLGDALRDALDPKASQRR